MSRIRAAARAAGVSAWPAGTGIPFPDGPGHRSGEGADSVWPHLEHDGCQKLQAPVPAIPEEAEPE